jgi:hypothetical protein
MLDFAAVQLNVAKLPSDIARSLGQLREQVQKRVQPLWTNVIQRGKDLLTPLTNAPAKENVARVTAGDLRGKIGKVHAVDRQEGQTHQMGIGLPFRPGTLKCQTNYFSPPFALRNLLGVWARTDAYRLGSGGAIRNPNRLVRSSANRMAAGIRYRVINVANITP